MKRIIKRVLEEYSWKYLEDGNLIKLDVEGESSSWSSFFNIEGDGIFTYYSVLPAKAEPDRLRTMSELLLRINYTLRVGGFEINLSDGEGRGQIMLKTYGMIPDKLLEENSAMAEEIVRSAAAFNMLTMDFYSKPLLKAIYSDEVNIDEILKFTERGEQI